MKDHIERYELGLPQLNDCFMHEAVHNLPNKVICLWFYGATPDNKWLVNKHVFFTEADLARANVILSPRFPKVVTCEYKFASTSGGSRNRMKILFEEGDIELVFSESFFFTKTIPIVLNMGPSFTPGGGSNAQ